MHNEPIRIGDRVRFSKDTVFNGIVTGLCHPTAEYPNGRVIVKGVTIKAQNVERVV